MSDKTRIRPANRAELEKLAEADPRWGRRVSHRLDVWGVIDDQIEKAMRREADERGLWR